MKHQLSKISVHDTAEALQAAEARLERPEANGGAPVYVQVKPKDIGERLELFQPRRPGYGELCGILGDEAIRRRGLPACG